MGWLLGLDGATEQLTLALVRSEGADTFSRSLPGGAQASAQLLPAVQALLQEAGVQGRELQAIGFGQGPGAFTSLRAICAATQGLAEGWGLPVLALDSLLLSVDEAAGATPAPGLWAAVMDARMGELYAASYRRSAQGWQAELAPSLWSPVALQAHWATAAPDFYAGHGVPLLAGVPAHPSQGRGAALARLLVQAWVQGQQLDAAAAQPLYVRNRVALTTAEREAQRAEGSLVNAMLAPQRLDWRVCQLADVDALLAIEQRAYSHPWTRGNFVDSLAGGHWAWCAHDEAGRLSAYWLAMPVLDELHLLNLAVDPSLQGRGLGRAALEHLHAVAAERGLHDVWLEVRESNQRAQQLYRAAGYAAVGRRRAYYPASPVGREDALLMRRQEQA